MVERLVVLGPSSGVEGAQGRLQSAGGRLLARYGDTVWVVELPVDAEPVIASDPAVRGVFAGPVPDTVAPDDEAGRLGVAAWNLRQTPSFRASREARRGEGRAWDDDGFEPEG